MTLSRRVSFFFLSSLAIVLVGFSSALCLLARTYLFRRVDARIDAVLTTLAASAEFKRDGIEWEPNQRPIAIGLSSDPGEPRWMVQDQEGRVIDHSRNLTPAESSPEIFKRNPWKFARRRVVTEHRRLGHRRYASLELTTAVDLEPIWCARLARGGLDRLVVDDLDPRGGRRQPVLSRRASTPHSDGVLRGAMKADDLDRRLPVSTTGDELENLGRSFNGLLDRLQEAFERQRRFSGDASHQLRTPLTALIGQIDVALRRERSALEYREVLNLARDQAEHMSRIVEALLFLARADADAPLPGIALLDLVAWTDRHLAEAWNDHPCRLDFVRDAAGIDSTIVLAHPRCWRNCLTI